MKCNLQLELYNDHITTFHQLQATVEQAELPITEMSVVKRVKILHCTEHIYITA